MDVDLSTDLAALAPLVAPLLSGRSDLAVGSRLSPSSRVVRGARREFISRTYNVILGRTLAARFTDAQCGFKAIRRDVAEHLLPLVEDTGWFSDTEPLVPAQRCGLRIAEVPVHWVEDPDSSVHILATVAADLRGVAPPGPIAHAGIPADRDHAGPSRGATLTARCARSRRRSPGGRPTSSGPAGGTRRPTRRTAVRA